MIVSSLFGETTSKETTTSVNVKQGIYYFKRRYSPEIIFYNINITYMIIYSDI